MFLKAASTLTPILRLIKLAHKNEIKLCGGSGGCSLHMRQESFPVRVSPSKMTNETIPQRSERLNGSRVASWQSSKFAKKVCPQWGGACGSSCMPNTAIQRLPLLGEHVLIRSDDVNANAVEVCRCCRMFSSSEVTPQ